MKIKLETITPEKAREMLRQNTTNRPVRDRHVAFLASEMISGRWIESSSPIVFTEDGKLADGQHRLLAIILSGQTIVIAVARGVVPAARDVIDAGMVPRSNADVLHMQDGLKNANMFAAAANAIVELLLPGYKMKVSVTTVRYILDQFSAEFAYIQPLVENFRPAKKGPVIGVLAVALAMDKRVKEFIDDFVSGEGLKKHAPATALRNWFINGRYNPRDLSQVLNVVHAFCQGQPVQLIKPGRRGVDYFLGLNKAKINNLREHLKAYVEMRAEERSETHRKRKDEKAP